MAARHVIVIFPDSCDDVAVESFRATWDPLAGMVPAHITLVFPFETQAGGDALRQTITDVARRHAEFPIEFADPVIRDREYLFLLARQGGEQVRRIHLALYAALPDAHTAASFVPHVTIGRHRDCRQLDRARLYAQAQNLHIRGYARRLSAYRIGKDGERHVLFSVPLGLTPDLDLRQR